MEHFGTSRLIARDWTVADVAPAFAIYGQAEVARWLGAQPRTPVGSLEEMAQVLDRRIARSVAEPDYGLWPVQLRSTGEIVGAVLLAKLPGPGPGPGFEVEIGWHLNPDHWGHGYATEAGRGVTALAFGLDEVGQTPVGPAAAQRHPRPVLARVLALTDPGNDRSQAVCRRLGMRHLGQTDQYYGLSLELFELTQADMT